MPKIYVKDKNGKWNKIDVGRCSELPIIVDWGGCTGDIISIDMDELWDDGSTSFSVRHHSCTTQDIGGIIIDENKLEVK